MHEDDAKIHRLSNFITGGVVTFSLIAIPVIGILGTRTIFTNPNSGFRLAGKIIISIWLIALYAFGLTIPYDIAPYLMQILWSHYWAATFRANWKPGDKVKYDWIRGYLDVTWHALDIIGKFLINVDRTIC